MICFRLLLQLNKLLADGKSKKKSCQKCTNVIFSHEQNLWFDENYSRQEIITIDQ